MRTQDEIVARIEERKERDPFGFEVSEYIAYLDYTHAKPYLKPEVKPEEWTQLELNKVIDVMIGYMPFAWEKANNCRGISAGRSLSHYVAWLWLNGDDTLWRTLFDNYEYYGKDSLRKICLYLGLDADQWDDGRRVNSDSE
jgi:hypothetical protein